MAEEQNGGRKIAVVENDIEWIKEALERNDEAHSRIESRLNALTFKTLTIGGAGGVTTSILLLLLYSQLC